MIKYKILDKNLILNYLILYKKFFKNFNKNLKYLNWLYVKNPMENILE